MKDTSRKFKIRVSAALLVGGIAAAPACFLGTTSVNPIPFDVSTDTGSTPDADVSSDADTHSDSDAAVDVPLDGSADGDAQADGSGEGE